jgi:hypothetical protein
LHQGVGGSELHEAGDEKRYCREVRREQRRQEACGYESPTERGKRNLQERREQHERERRGNGGFEGG